MKITDPKIQLMVDKINNNDKDYQKSNYANDIQYLLLLLETSLNDKNNIIHKLKNELENSKEKNIAFLDLIPKLKELSDIMLKLGLLKTPVIVG